MTKEKNDNLEEIKTVVKRRKKRTNIDGEIVPYKCTECGGDIGMKFRGIGSYVCEKCGKNMEKCLYILVKMRTK